jgi:hypothetical protein
MSDATPSHATKTSHTPGNQGKRRSRRVSPVSLGSLNDPDTFKGFTTHDLISGLHGVCVVIDSAIVDGTTFHNHLGTMACLAMAAKALSAILHTEVHS